MEGTGRMREQGSLKSEGEGTHRGNLFVNIFEQKSSLKDIQKKKANNKFNCLFAFWKYFQRPKNDYQSAKYQRYVAENDPQT